MVGGWGVESTPLSNKGLTNTKNQSQHFRGGLRGNKKKNNKWKVCDYNRQSSTAESLNSYWENVHEK